VRFFLQSLKKQKDVLMRKVEREQILERMSPVSEQLVALAKERGRITISEAVILLSINRNTAKLHFRQLVESGHLVQHGTGRATWYTAGRL
jgi:predicted HTH transcriptional regulator